jgi:polygalacturonase
MRILRIAALLLATTAGRVSAAAMVEPVIPARTCDVTHYDAEGSRIWSQLVHTDTVAFQRAIDDCARQGGGTVLVPEGSWLIGPIRLASNIRLHLAHRAELAATSEAEAYAPGPDGRNRGLIEVTNAHDVAIDGDGLIDGQGAVWWERMRALWRSNPAFATDGAARQGFHDARPRLILVRDSRRIAIRGVTIANSASYHVVIQDSDDVSVIGTTISAPAHAPNTDGIDPVNSRHVLIRNNHISVGDDMVAIKSDRADSKHPGAASEDIEITDNVLGFGRGICIGSDTQGGVHHIQIARNRFEGSMYGIRIKSARGRGGPVSDIRIEHNRMQDVETPIVLSAYYGYRPMNLRAAEKILPSGGFILGNQSWPGPDDPPRSDEEDTPHITDVSIDHLIATGARSAGIVTGLPEAPIEARLTHVRIAAENGLLVRNATLTISGHPIEASHGFPMRLERGGRLIP